MVALVRCPKDPDLFVVLGKDIGAQFRIQSQWADISGLIQFVGDELVGVKRWPGRIIIVEQANITPAWVFQREPNRTGYAGSPIADE